VVKEFLRLNHLSMGFEIPAFGLGFKTLKMHFWSRLVRLRLLLFLHKAYAFKFLPKVTIKTVWINF